MESVLISYLVLGMLLLADAKESYKCSIDPDNECKFPFTYKGEVYNECVDGWDYWCYTDDDENYEYCKLCEVPDATTTDLINATSAKTTQSADSNLLSTVWSTAKSVTTHKASIIDVEPDSKASTMSALRSTATVSAVASSASNLQTSRSSENRNKPDPEATTTTDFIDAAPAKTESADSDLLSTLRVTAKPVTANKASAIDAENHIEASAISSSVTDLENKVTTAHSLSFVATSALRSATTTTVRSVASSESSFQSTSPPSENKKSEVSRCSVSKEYPCLFPFEAAGEQHYECTTTDSYTGAYWCRTAEPRWHFAYCKICNENEVAPENLMTQSTSTSPTTTRSALPVDKRLSSAPKKRISSTLAAVKLSESPSRTTQFYSPKSKVLLTTHSDAMPDPETQQIPTSSMTPEQIISTTEETLHSPVVSKAFSSARPTTTRLDRKQIASSPDPEPTPPVERPINPKSKPATESSPPTQSQGQDAKESVPVLDSRYLKTANIMAVSTADKISTGMTTTQKAIDPRLVKVPTNRSSATDNYNQDEDGDKANGKSGHVTIILIILLLLVVITGVFVIVLCLRRRRLRASKHQEAEIGESGDNLLKQNGSDKSVSADGSQEMQPLNENCSKTMPGDDVVIKDGIDSKIDCKATVTV